jgi:MYXO-CTERM domain-containing protein
VGHKGEGTAKFVTKFARDDGARGGGAAMTEAPDRDRNAREPSLGACEGSVRLAKDTSLPPERADPTPATLELFKMTRTSLPLGLGVLVGATAMFHAACSTSKSSPNELFGRVSQGIQCLPGNNDCGNDTTHRFAVGIYIGAIGGSCSGTLIAPNLVLTARHCVTSSPQTIDCATSTFPTGTFAPSTFRVTTASTSGASNPYGVSQVIVPTGPGTTKACGNDIALLILSSNVTGVTPAVPLVQYSMTDHDRTTRAYAPSGFSISTTYVAIGYGADGDPNDPSTNFGTRRIDQNVNLTCIPGDPVVDCGSLTGTNLDVKEWAGGNGVCPGDSGGGAYEQQSFDRGTPIVMGIAVRAGVQNGNCVGSAYTRTDAWSALIIQAAKTAAQLGGYTAPAWTNPIPPEPDAGASQDSGTTPGRDSGTSSPAPKSLGEECATNDECESGSCAAIGDGPQTCTQACSETNECPDGFACKSGYCFAGAPATTNNASPATTTTESGCSVAPDPGQPQPWKAFFVVVGLGVAALSRRRRRG